MIFVLSLLMALYIIIPSVISGYVIGIFLVKSGPMRLADVRTLLGLFFPIVLIGTFIQQTINESLRSITENLFSLSGHYMICDTIFSFYLLILFIILQILTHPWKTGRFFRFVEYFISKDIQNAQRKEAEHDGNARSRRERSKVFCCNTSL